MIKMPLPGPESRAFARLAAPPREREENFWASGKKYAPEFWSDVQRSMSERALQATRVWDNQTVDTYWRLLALGNAFGYWSAAKLAEVVAPRLAEVGPDNWLSAVVTALPAGGGGLGRWLVGRALGGSRVAKVALDTWYHPASRLVRLAATAGQQFEPATPPPAPPSQPPGQQRGRLTGTLLKPIARAGAPRGRGALPPTRFTFAVRKLPGQVRTGPGGRLEFPGVEITASPRPNLLRDLGQRLTATPVRPRSAVPTPPLAPPATQRFDFRVRELPGRVRTGRGGRMEFPGVEITAYPRPNLLRDLGRHLEATPTAHPPQSRFDWSVRQLPGEIRPGPRGQLRFPGVEVTARPRPNLLTELGQRLTRSPTHYDFSIRQSPGPIRPRPGGGMEFPPMYVTAVPASQPTSQNLLRDLAGRLRQTR